MKKIVITLLLVLVVVSAQNNPNNNYYPLQEGNRWVYLSEGHRTEIIGGSVWVLPWYSPLVVEVVSDTVFNSNTVWKIRYMSYTYNFAKYDTNYTYEIYSPTGDSLYTGHYEQFSPWDDNLRFVFNSNIGETINVKIFDYRFMQHAINLINTSNATEDVFGLNTNVMNFGFQDLSEQYTQKFGEGLGLIEQYGKASDNSWESRINLQGCVIDGIAYGDTSLIVSVEDGKELPSEFSLEQNYPNPFNPSTRIKFTISNVETQHAVSLRIYDILGREIKTLINKPIQPGEYEVTFDGSDLPSGTYFYRLSSGDFVESRKMVLLK